MKILGTVNEWITSIIPILLIILFSGLQKFWLPMGENFENFEMKTKNSEVVKSKF